MENEIKFTKQTGDKMLSILRKLEDAFDEAYHVAYANGDCCSRMSKAVYEHRDSQVLRAYRGILKHNTSIEAECERLELLGKTIGTEARENKQ